MSRHKPKRDQVHDEMLRHLEQNPPRKRARPTAPEAEPPERKMPPTEPARPQLMLRRLRLETALERLASFVRFHAQRGTPEILIIVGKGLNSPEGAVVGPAVRAWCEREARVVAIREAGLREGGAGALILSLTPSN